MKGDDRVRHCIDCNLNVYNFSAMSERGIQRLLLAKNGRICGRWYRRSDGTIITADCPVGFRARVKKISLVAGTALSTLLSLSPAAAQTSGTLSDSTARIENNETGSGIIVVTVMDEVGALIQKARVTVLDSLNKTIVEGETNDVGGFRAAGLKSGSYSLRVASIGFGQSETRGVVVSSEKDEKVKVAMRVSAAIMGVVVELQGAPLLPEGRGDTPILLAPVPAVDVAGVQKPRTIRRLFSKMKGDTK